MQAARPHKNRSSANEVVAVIGGGLAGLTAAIELARRGLEVHLYEAEGHLGGQAGSTPDPTSHFRAVEHAYHFFPPWYLNLFRLMERAGISTSKALYPAEYLHFAYRSKPNRPRKIVSLKNLASIRDAPYNLLHGPLRWWDFLGFLATNMDLASMPESSSAWLDRISVEGFVRSRSYASSTLAEAYEGIIFKALSFPLYMVSAKTIQNLMASWPHYSKPMFRMMKGDMGRELIEPLQQLARRTGVFVHPQSRLQRFEYGRKAISLYFHGEALSAKATRLVCAIPPCALVEVLEASTVPRGHGDAISRLRASLLRIPSLPMFTIHYPLTEEWNLPVGLPAGSMGCAFDLHGSRYGLSFISLSHAWEGAPPTLNVCVTQASELTNPNLDHASDERVIEKVREELEAYLGPLPVAGVVQLNRNGEARLVYNQVGMWHHRPTEMPEDIEERLLKERETRRIQRGYRGFPRRLYLAGDYCRSHVDLICMEGAVVTGLHAAEHVRRDVVANSSATQKPLRVRVKIYKPDRTSRSAHFLRWYSFVLPLTVVTTVLSWPLRILGELTGRSRW